MSLSFPISIFLTWELEVGKEIFMEVVVLLLLILYVCFVYLCWLLFYKNKCNKKENPEPMGAWVGGKSSQKKTAMVRKNEPRINTISQVVINDVLDNQENPQVNIDIFNEAMGFEDMSNLVPSAPTLKDNECTICYSEIQHGSRVCLQCGHNQFCFACISRIRIQKNSCPCCRVPIQTAIRMFWNIKKTILSCLFVSMYYCSVMSCGK